MRVQEKLLNLIHNEVLSDIDDYLDDLFELVASKKATQEQKDEIKELQEMRKDFMAIVEDIENDDMDEEEAQEIIDEIIDMKSL